jgi:hypothetical protein
MIVMKMGARCSKRPLGTVPARPLASGVRYPHQRFREWSVLRFAQTASPQKSRPRAVQGRLSSREEIRNYAGRNTPNSKEVGWLEIDLFPLGELQQLLLMPGWNEPRTTRIAPPINGRPVNAELLAQFTKGHIEF